MSWKNELENTKKIFRTGTKKQKLEYIWDYYKWHILVTVLVLCFIRQTLYTNTTAKTYVLQGVFLNNTADSDDIYELENDFLQKFPIDSSKEAVFFDSSLFYIPSGNNEVAVSSYETIQVLMARMSAGDVDFMLGDTSTLIEFAYNQYFYDLSDVLSDEQYKKYEPYFLYFDKELVELLNNSDPLDYEKVSFPDPSKPELMQEPVQIMIDITLADKISKIYPYSSNDYSMAFVIDGINSEKAIEFLEYLIS